MKRPFTTNPLHNVVRVTEQSASSGCSTRKSKPTWLFNKHWRLMTGTEKHTSAMKAWISGLYRNLARSTSQRLKLPALVIYTLNTGAAQ